jgi:hypothetical protein
MAFNLHLGNQWGSFNGGGRCSTSPVKELSVLTLWLLHAYLELLNLHRFACEPVFFMHVSLDS